MAESPEKVMVLGDLHCGSTRGIWPLQYAITDGGILEANQYQKWLYHCWRNMLAAVDKMNRPVLIINGDIIQGVNPRDGQQMSNLVSVQCGAAEKLLRPLVDLCRQVYVIRGTEFHEGKNSSDIEQLAESLGAVPIGNEYSRWELYLDIDSKLTHFAHHISVSGMPWGQAAAPARDVLIQMLELARVYGHRAPALRMMVRSHRHRYIAVHQAPDLWSVTVPCWQLPTSYVYRKAPSTLPEIGYVAIEELRGELIPRPYLYELPKPLVVKA